MNFGEGKKNSNLFLVEMRSAFKMITTTTLALSVCLMVIKEHIFGGVDSAGVDHVQRMQQSTSGLLGIASYEVLKRK